jgi:membrane associated rhomboid family serine protease
LPVRYAAGYTLHRISDRPVALVREPLTIKLLWATLGCLVLTLLPAELMAHLVLWPLDLGAAGGADKLAVLGNFMPWQLATHLLVDSVWGLVFVALTLYYFGGQLESMWGTRRYGLFLLACAAGAAVIQLVVSSAAWALGANGNQAATGSAGVMYGILFALAYIAPFSQVRLLIPPVTLQMRTLVIVFAVIAFVSGVKAQGVWVQFGFLGGMLSAWLHIRFWRGLPPFRRRPPPPSKKKSHLRVV